MANHDPQLRSLIDQFVSELTVIIHQQALDTVREALGESTAPKRRGPGRPPKSAGPKLARSASRKGGRRSPEDVAALGETILSHVKANPGHRLEEIGRELGIATKELKRPITNLMEAGSLRTEGQKRGTKYFSGSGKKQKPVTRKKGPQRKTAKKRGRKKAA